MVQILPAVFATALLGVRRLVGEENVRVEGTSQAEHRIGKPLGSWQILSNQPLIRFDQVQVVGGERTPVRLLDVVIRMVIAVPRRGVGGQAGKKAGRLDAGLAHTPQKVEIAVPGRFQ